MRTSAIFGAKNVGFFEIYGVSARKREKKSKISADILWTRGGVNFSRFCADVLYGRPLISVLRKIDVAAMLCTD